MNNNLTNTKCRKINQGFHKKMINLVIWTIAKLTSKENN